MPLALVAGATERTADEVKQEVSEAIEAIGANSASQRDETGARVHSAIESLDRHIERLESRADAEWERMARAARERARASLRTLRKQRAEMAEWSGRLRESSAGAWDRVKQGFVNHRALADSFQSADRADTGAGEEPAAATRSASLAPRAQVLETRVRSSLGVARQSGWTKVP